VGLSWPMSASIPAWLLLCPGLWHKEELWIWREVVGMALLLSTARSLVREQIARDPHPQREGCHACSAATVKFRRKTEGSVGW